jgi:hypothetical protein
MPKGLIYDRTTGEVIMALTTSNPTFEAVDSTPNTDYDIVEGLGADDTHYIDISVTPVTIETKTDLSADFDKLTVTANGTDTATLSTLPNPCTVYVDEVATIVTDGSFEFTADAVGTYSIRVSEVSYIRKDWIINAN